jgi:hypothetical protein
MSISDNRSEDNETEVFTFIPPLYHLGNTGVHGSGKIALHGVQRSFRIRTNARGGWI